MRKYVFITFGSGIYKRAVDRICLEAKNFQIFNEINGYTERDLKADPNFWNTHGNFIQNNKRGYGYWLWKPYLIQQKLNTLNDGDILVYADSGCEINPNGKPRFYEYVDMLDKDINQYGLLTFQMGFLEKQYTKSTIFDWFKADETIKNSGQCVGGIQIIKKTEHSLNIINKWVENMHYQLINDNLFNEISEFKDNRHDQSIYSIIVKIYGSIKIPDETWYNNWDDGKLIPFLAKRNK
jgi:hypothetical protein